MMEAPCTMNIRSRSYRTNADKIYERVVNDMPEVLEESHMDRQRIPRNRPFVLYRSLCLNSSEEDKDIAEDTPMTFL